LAQHIRKAVFPVGGLGTRFLPATKAMPKEMLPVVDKPLIQYAVEEAQAAGIEEFIFVTGKGKTAIEDHFDRSDELERTLAARGKTKEIEALRRCSPPPGRVAYVRQSAPLGLGHAVWCAHALVGDEPFAVLLADDLVLSETPCLAQMVAAHAELETRGHMVAVMDVPRSQTDKYGILDVAAERGSIAQARGVVEKPAPSSAPSTLSIIGRYILQPSVFQHLERMERGAGSEIQLTDALAAGLPDVPLSGFRFDGRRFDCGDKIGFLEANLAFAAARPELRTVVREIARSHAWAPGPNLRVVAGGEADVAAKG
jgi:UTP--glucose-1-phosphate uridylyltransferase